MPHLPRCPDLRSPRAALLAALATLPLAACATTTAPPGCPQSRNWAAWVNAMPGPDARPGLIVSGEVNLAPGQSATLIPGATDRMMPPGQRFNLSTWTGGGTGGWQEVRAEIRPAQLQYREVIVECGGSTLAQISPVQVAR